MELEKRGDQSSSDLREETHRSGREQGGGDDEILKAIDRAVEYGFCLNRVWVVARGLGRGILDLPGLLPPYDAPLERMFKHEGASRDVYIMEKNPHEKCTFDFCEQSQINFTSISQRHESSSCRVVPHCEPIEGLFPRDVLNEAVIQGRETAWQLNGTATIEPGEKYMAISHVWSDGTGAGAWDGLKTNRCLYHFSEN